MYVNIVVFISVYYGWEKEIEDFSGNWIVKDGKFEGVCLMV